MARDEKPQEKPEGERLLFIRRALVAPRYLGSITPSSHYLVDTLLRLCPVSAARAVVELGPGTGPFTQGLLGRMPADGRLLCIERDPALAHHLRTRFVDPRLAVVTGDAQSLDRHLADHGLDGEVPLIVSGLPFTSLPAEMRESILATIERCLTPDGCFLLYQYSNAMRRHLRRHFRQVTSRREVRNIPPAVCIRCTR
ncbi:MAG: class I SAM-dependent methyltransferase [Chloroflexota bacterium]